MTWPLRAACTVALLGLAASARAQTAEEPAPGPPADAPGSPADPPAPVAPEAAPAPVAAPPVAAKVVAVPAKAEDEAYPTRDLTVQIGPVALAPVALLAVQAAPVVGGDSLFQAGDTAERPGFRLRRARLGIAGDVADKARFKLSGELGSSDDARLLVHDAWLGYTQLAYVQVHAGAREVPYSRSAMTGTGDSALIERPLAVRAMAPGHQVGFAVSGDVAEGTLGYALGAYNGFERDTQFYAGYLENHAPVGNRFDGLAYAARLSTEPVGRLGRTIEDIDHSPLRVGAGASFFFSDGGARTIKGIGGDLLVHVAGLHVLGEVLWSQVEPVSVPTRPTTQVFGTTSLGVVAEAGTMILPRTLGATARFELIDPNDAVDDEADNWLFTGGVSYHVIGELFKVQADYTHREERFGQSLDNDALALQLQLHL